DGGQFLEIHVSQCPEGTDPDAGSLYDACHDNGMTDVGVTISGPDSELDKTTVRVNDAGPGIVNTGDIAPGDYTFSVDLPGDSNDFSLYCAERDSDTRVPAQPDDASMATVTVSEGVSV